MQFPRHKPLSGLPAKHTRRLEDELRRVNAELEELAPSYLCVHANADVDPDSTTWVGIHTEYTLFDGHGSGDITRVDSTFTFARAGRYLWHVTLNFSNNNNTLGLRVREGSTTHITGFCPEHQGTLNGIVEVAARARQDLQIVVSAGSSALSQLTLDGQIMSNLNLSIVRLGGL